jgi:hypothetical protein
MTEDERNELNAVLAAHQAHIADAMMEESARISAVRFLLEDVYADGYVGNLEGFNTRMEALIGLTRTQAVRANQMTDEDATEMQIRIATHLQRFQDAVAPRIKRRSEAQDRGS